ncbi:methyltransferase domain-containing protein [Lacinutrix jangbogonensis]|uniref:methyltransferase domain-containing protein n=1 Tax=Lacinutrix jangbogonensis TaxID=1469557 RepID=UPI00053EFC59|nr:methyltransferase domain-containing protein [Lacinutrix jangbogonensis]
MKFHKKKSLVFKTLNVLPSSLGYYLYHIIQKRSFKNISKNIIANKNSRSVIKHILNSVNFNLTNKSIIEIGSGWLPLMPYLLKAEELCKTIYTYDLNSHYNLENITRLNHYFKTEENISFKKRQSDKYNLPEFIEYYPNTNIIDTDLPKDISLVYSRFVLEHVKPSDILKMHQKFYSEISNDTYVLHLISPSDHRAYSDSSLSYYDFLKYSKKEWNSIQTKFDYHNRLRLPQYLSVFENAGFDVVYLNYDKTDASSDKYKKFKAIDLHEDYTGFSEEEILAGSINILLKKKKNN